MYHNGSTSSAFSASSYEIIFRNKNSNLGPNKLSFGPIISVYGLIELIISAASDETDETNFGKGE